MSAVVLASGSRYRAQQLARLHLPFDCVPANIDEIARADEPPADTAVRLAQAKARHVAASHPQAIVIGSDQVAERDGRAIGKPGDAASARHQLEAASGRRLRFFTAVCVLAPLPPAMQQHLDTTAVQFRRLAPAEIDRYIALEQPLDCAGSFKCEALGIALFEAIDSRDPSALVGLPLIAVAAMLRNCGVPVP